MPKTMETQNVALSIETVSRQQLLAHRYLFFFAFSPPLLSQSRLTQSRIALSQPTLVLAYSSQNLRPHLIISHLLRSSTARIRSIVEATLASSSSMKRAHSSQSTMERDVDEKGGSHPSAYTTGIFAFAWVQVVSKKQES